MSDTSRNELEELRQRSESLKQQATELFDQARDLDAKIRYYEQVRKGSNASSPQTARPPRQD